MMLLEHQYEQKRNIYTKCLFKNLKGKTIIVCFLIRNYVYVKHTLRDR